MIGTIKIILSVYEIVRREQVSRARTTNELILQKLTEPTP